MKKSHRTATRMGICLGFTTLLLLISPSTVLSSSIGELPAIDIEIGKPSVDRIKKERIAARVDWGDEEIQTILSELNKMERQALFDRIRENVREYAIQQSIRTSA